MANAKIKEVQGTGEGMRIEKTVSQKLLFRLRELGLEIPNQAQAISLGRGYWQKKNGAWSWHIVDKDGCSLRWDIGSPDTMRECLEAEKLTYYSPNYLRSYVVCVS